MSTLVKRIILGEEAAVLEFYKKFVRKITKFVRKKMSSGEDMQELVNDIFLEAIDNMPKLKDSEKIESWLFAIANNKITDYYRKKKLKSIVLSQLPFFDVVDKEIHQPEFIYEKNKLRDKIENTLRNISRKYRKIISLHYEQGISIKDLSLKLNLSFKAAESLLFRARKSFKKNYEKS